MAAVRVWECGKDGTLRPVQLDQVCTTSADSWYWIDVTDADVEVIESLECMSNVHPLAIEDVLHRQARPKIDVFDDGVFITWLTPIHTDEGPLHAVELDAYLGSRTLVTFRQGDDLVTHEAVEQARSSAAKDPAWLLHGILDRLVDHIIPIVEKNSDRLDDLEESLLLATSSQDLVDLYSVRRDLVTLRRLVTPAREVVRALARESESTEHGSFWYFQDVLDHLTAVEDAIETDREVAAAVMDIYLSAQNNRTNDIMRQLTVVATIFMPLTLISGIYGMNLLGGMWPPVRSYWSFGAVVAAMVALATAMIAYFRRKNWW